MQFQKIYQPLIFCFAGQGSQYFGMGADLFKSDPVFAFWFRRGAELLRASHGLDLIDEVLGPHRRIGMPFDDLAVSHPALFVIQFSLARALLERGVRPDVLWGVSLGEIVALAVAEAIPFETALDAVANQPAVFAACPPGGMLAVLASADIRRELPVELEVGGESAPQHCVLSGPADSIAAAQTWLQAREIACQRLWVPYAFHSRWIAAAEQAYRANAARLVFDAPQIPCWSSASLSMTHAPTSDTLWRIVRGPMRVRASAESFERQGGAHYLDLSPSGTFAALLRYTIPTGGASTTKPLMSPFGGNPARVADAIRTFAAPRDGIAPLHATH